MTFYYSMLLSVPASGCGHAGALPLVLMLVYFSISDSLFGPVSGVDPGEIESWTELHFFACLAVMWVHLVYQMKICLIVL